VEVTPPRAMACEASRSPRGSCCTAPGAVRRKSWAKLIRRVYEVDPLLCRCGERMRVVGFITRPPVILKIFHHIGRRFDPLKLPGRSPPCWINSAQTRSRTTARNKTTGGRTLPTHRFLSTPDVCAGFGLIPIPWWVYRRRKAAGSSDGRGVVCSGAWSLLPGFPCSVIGRGKRKLHR